MTRPWHTWFVFALCLLVVLASLSWISTLVLRLESAGSDARRQAQLEELVRLSLWRIDSTVAPLVARENARRYFEYSAFHPLDQSYTRMFQSLQYGDVLMPSPLLLENVPQVLLHFQFGPDGAFMSPQVPTSNMRDLAELHQYATHDQIEAAAQRLASLSGRVNHGRLVAAVSRASEPVLEARDQRRGTIKSETQAPIQDLAQQRSSQEWRARFVTNQLLLQEQKQSAAKGGSPVKVNEGLVQAVWLDGLLLLVRRVIVDSETYVQGCWVNWPDLRAVLLDTIADLMPEAKLEPFSVDEEPESLRRMASLPVGLEPGTVANAIYGPWITPLRISLIVAWVGVLLAASAVAVLLRGAVSLSERRGAFVSAVTHELRTPLTTFRMYTDMLVEGMVPDESKRRQYLTTMRAEADRLAVLVQNVLAYARLERGGAANRPQATTLGELLERVGERLSQRAAQSGMRLEVETGDTRQTSAARLCVDVSAVDQVLFNLVDNACKFCANADDRRIHLGAAHVGGSVVLSLSDHGPGIEAQDARRLFRPFTKSAHEAAHTAPGVGLGLALSRRLVRSMGGDLSIDTRHDGGARFVLTLPADPPIR